MNLRISHSSFLWQHHLKTAIANSRWFCNMLLLTAGSLLGACALPAAPPFVASPASAPNQIQAPDGFAVEPLPYTFAQPTQFLVDGNLLWVAQLNGGENQVRGQVVTVNLDTGEQTLRLDNLDKPTGIALIDEILWIATRDELLKWPTTRTATGETAGATTTPEVVLTNLPNNGRSNGTLTVTPEDTLLYETSGNTSEKDSGRLWELDPTTGETRVVATGLKGGYAHAFDEAGRLWLTEIADGSVDNVTLPGEVNMLLWHHPSGDDATNRDEIGSENGAIPDFGWPRCYGRELAGPNCANVRAAVTVLPVHSTPTGIALSPFDPDTLLVPLWVTGQVVTISVSLIDGDAYGQNAIGDAQPWLTGLRNPQHILVDADGSVLVSEYATGTIYRVQSLP